MDIMTPEEKAMTEKAMQMPSSGDQPKIPLREDTFNLVGSGQQQSSSKEPPADQVAPPAEEVAEETTEIAQVALTKVIDDKLATLKKVDFLTISISKLAALVGLGVILILIWLLPVINFGIEKVSQGQYSLANLRSDRLFGLYQSPTPSPAAMPIKIRIKTSNDSLAAVGAVELILRQGGYSWLETVYDPNLTNSGILVVTSDGNDGLKQELQQLLEANYLISSEAATLTADSDFGAVVLIGKEASRSAATTSAQ